MTLAPTALFVPPVRARRARILPWGTVMAGSLVTILPIAATLPLLPPAGLLMLLAWRLLAPLALRVWAPSLLGLFDDLVSGQPLGSGMLLWQMAVFAVALFDQRTMFRDFWVDWLIATVLIAFCLIGGRMLALPVGAHVDAALGVQIVLSALVFPLAMRLVAWIDRRRQPR